jgi:hypothetical protein
MSNPEEKKRSVFILTRSDLEGMIQQYVESEPGDAIGEYKGLGPEALVKFCRDTFGMQLKYLGNDEFDQV